MTSAVKEWCKGLDGVTSIDFSIPDGVVYVKLTSKAKAGEGNLQHVPAISFIRPDMRPYRCKKNPTPLSVQVDIRLTGQFFFESSV